MCVAGFAHGLQVIGPTSLCSCKMDSSWLVPGYVVMVGCWLLSCQCRLGVRCFVSSAL